MDYRNAFAPDLRLCGQEFVAAWNDAPDCRQPPEPGLLQQAPQGLPTDPPLVEQGLAPLATAVGQVGSVVLDAVKEAVRESPTLPLKAKPREEPPIKVESVRQPGGAWLILVTEEDG